MVNYLFVALAYLYIGGLVPIRGDLYNSSDSLVILNQSNFNSELINVRNAWIIQFYNTWCGHCFHFAPTWKEFGKDIKEWDHTIKIGAIDCADDENTPICRRYEIMMYPSIKLFGPFTNTNEKGEDIESRHSMQTAIVDFITKKETNVTISVPDTWVMLSKYKGLIKDVFQSAPSKAVHSVIIVQKENSSIAPQVILDLGHYSMIYVRWMEADGKEVKDLASIPAVIFIDRNGHRETLTKKTSTREELTALILHHTHQKRRTQSDTTEVDHLEQEEGAGDGLNLAPSPVYMMDIESALSYALRHEVALHKVLTNESQMALRNFLDVLIESFPLRSEVHKTLVRLQEFVAKGTVKGELFARQIVLITKDSSYYLPEKQVWIGCLGSQPHLRGYPCGLWTLFHTLTVNAFLKRRNDPLYEPFAIIEAIHGYVKYFFTCTNCSKNFQQMFSVDAESKVKKAGDEVLWLWEVHNAVNKRLKGDLTEDPKHPKHEFPLADHCPTCRFKSGQFNRNRIVSFLTKLYGKDSLSNKNVTNKRGLSLSSPSPYRIYEKKLIRSDAPVYDFTKSWGFNTTDISMCVSLYLFSTLLIITVYCMFTIKRKLRKRSYLRLLS